MRNSILSRQAAAGLPHRWSRYLATLTLAGLMAGAWTAAAANPTPGVATDVATSVDPVAQALAQRPDGLALSAGQAATLLPNGTWLVSAGAAGRSAASTQLSIFDPVSRRITPLALHLNVARSGHTATLLPDGTVLVHGGTDAQGAPTARSEIVDQATGRSKLLDPTGLLGRTRHTASVLDDGRVLIAGGLDGRGAAVAAAEIYNPLTHQAEHFTARTSNVRIGGGAALLANGGVLLFGGVDAQGLPVATSELYDPLAQGFQAVTAATAQGLARSLAGAPSAPGVAFNQPVANGVDVAVDARLFVRFSTRLNVATLSNATVTLIGPGGSTPVRAVPVELGILLFVTPTQQLLPASQYTLFVQGAQDNARRALPLFSLGFKTQSLHAGSVGGLAGTGSAKGSAGADGASKSTARTPAELAGLLEDWIPEARHRRGEWMSHRAYLAQNTLPTHNSALRELLKNSNPTIPDPEAAVFAQAVSEQSPRIRRASWSEVDAQRRAQHAIKANAGPANGATSLAGQVLRLNGLPLAGVSLQLGTITGKTDDNGEFKLDGVPSGNQVLTIDASTADRPGVFYGRYQYLYNLEPGKANLLPFTVWMSKLDVKHAIHIDSPTRRDTVISNPTMPGLSIVLPAGTVVRDVDGKIVTEVSLSPIPVDQPPYPMPYVGVPLHYTLQPGGALIQGIDGKPKGAVVHYPNYTTFGAGTEVQLFDYDPKGRGWYVYSKAKVAPNGTDIASDRDFLIYQFGTTSYSSGGSTPDNPPPPACGSTSPDSAPPDGGGWGGGADAGAATCAFGGDPVDLQYGLFGHTERDLFVPDVMPIDIRRSYRPTGGFGAGGQVALMSKSFGADTSSSYESYLVFQPSNTRIDMVMGDGSVVHFDNPDGANSGGASYDALVYQNNDDQAGYRGATVLRDMAHASFVVTFKDGRHWGYSAYSARLIWIEDRVGNLMSISRPNVNAYVSRITSPNLRYVDFTYNTAGFIDTITDNLGRQFKYFYLGKELSSVQDPNAKSRTYDWEADLLKRIMDPVGNVLVENTFEKAITYTHVCEGAVENTLPTGRVLSQKLADASQFSYLYSTEIGSRSAGPCDIYGLIVPSTLTKVTDQRNVVRQVELDTLGNVVRNTSALGKVEQEVTSFVYDPVTNLLSSQTDALSRQTAFEYDAAGNATKVTRLAGTAGAVSIRATYDNVFNEPLTLTDANGHTTTLGYTATGALTSIKDALGHVTSIGREEQGRVASVTNALGKKTSFIYNSADLASVKDPLNRQVQYLTDAVGRVMTTIDGLGNRSYNSWDPLNRLLQITDAIGGQTRFSYDANGNVLTQTDAKGNATTFTYNAISKRASMKDALLNLEWTLYEPGGLVSQRTDRKGQVSGVTYDALGRVATIGFGATAAHPTTYTSSATLTWDAGNRLTKILDVQGGRTTTIKRGYDGLNRMTSEVTDQGELDYTYDNAGRRKTMTVKNGPATARTTAQSVTYDYDDANRLTTITQAAGAVNNNVAQVVQLTYDNANRVRKEAFTGGQSINVAYTDADEILSITYLKPDGTTLATGGYTYDAAGHRTSVTGDLATFVQANGADVTDAVYNVNNQLTKWRGKTFAYDNNGNLGSDGVNTYAWDERNQLKGITGGNTASFQYDGQGRRLAKTIAGATTAFAYDGDNFVQELAATGTSGAVNANLLTGGIDQLFMRSASGTMASLSWVLPEANNSTLITTDPAGVTKQTNAHPYGNTTTTGMDSNSQQYTGRENDKTGLYYYRNRYYMPGCMRFISEDPIGWASGQTNNYAYVGGDPVSLVDPSGLTTYNACETSDYFSQAQKQNIFDADVNHGRNGRFDFAFNSHEHDRWTIGDRTYNAHEFGNVLAGYTGGHMLGKTAGTFAVEAAGVVIDMMDHKYQGDYDASSRPYIKLGVTIGVDDAASGRTTQHNSCLIAGH